jgi:hypothetical protein
MGVLELYRRTAGNLTATEYACAETCAAHAAMFDSADQAIDAVGGLRHHRSPTHTARLGPVPES